MSDLTTHLITCQTPRPSTRLVGIERYPIAPLALWTFGTVDTVLTFPEELDVGRLKTAIGLLTSVWPTLGGRYERHQRSGEDGKFDFSFKLTSSSIPFSTQSITSPTAYPFPNRVVIQNSLSPFLPPMGPRYSIPNSDEPLFVIRLTTILPFRSSVLGINMSHLIGDGECGLRLVEILEQFYLHGEAALSPISNTLTNLLPTFGDHIALPPFQPEWDAIYSDWSVRGHDLKIRSETYARQQEISEKTVIEFDQQEIKRLKDEWVGKTGEMLSGQDVLSGWWVNLLERAGMKIDLVEYVLSHRHFCINHPSYPPDLPTLASNVSRVRTVPLPPHQPAGLTPGEIASLLRQAILELRSNPDITLPWLSSAAHHEQQAAIEEQGQILACGDGQVFINSNIKMNWHVTFGFEPHETTYHTADTGLLYLRVFQANPQEGERLGNRVELAFRLPKGGAKAAVADLTRRETQALIIE
ncbi:hypothetical protein CI109_100590 [Kwoniella shandongensis]|uniref:Uncharacterized protein n=1 Tax=Kwoniella shandongensis TaxID=1734106 RepID=A0A5M6BZ86_9TREE|nr:uncharacterized protein CI109_003487 [Kwoniella shandongensis]KAA5528198.1 hypothetical protein CI109_003487 [Kwoniella shandongensis]